MSIFKPEIFIKVKPVSKHPWEHRIKAKYSGTYKYGHNSVENPTFVSKKPKEPARLKLIVVGNRVTKEFIYCMHLVKGLYKYRKKVFQAPIIRGVTSVEWPKVWNDLKLQFGEKAYCIKSQVVVLLNNQILGGEEELIDFIESKYIYEYPKHLDFYKEGLEQFSNYVKGTGRPCAYLHMAIDDVPIGPLIFMLYADLVPLTCQNFIRLCELNKGGYVGTPVHRIVQDIFIQCGGFGIKNKYELDCENFIVPFDRRGVLGMANAGRNEDCSTQFFVLLQPAEWMSQKFVAFGQLIEGEGTLKKIEAVPTWYESPNSRITIYKAGVFNTECYWRAINKSTTEYISGHIEDLIILGTLLHDLILEHLYAALDKKKEEELSEAATAKTDSGNFVFDVEGYGYGELEEEKSMQQISDRLSTETPKSSRIVERPYYLPLTDVPYPGEVESTFNLQRLLRGDYCLEADLVPNREQRKNMSIKHVYNVPEELLDALFEIKDPDFDMSGMDLDSGDEKEIRKYIRDNIDKTSFGGPNVKSIANPEGTFEIFEHVDENKKFADEELRRIRVIRRELSTRKKKKVSLDTTMSVASNAKIHRRPTGFVRQEDLQNIKELLEKIQSIDKKKEEQRRVYLEDVPEAGKGRIRRRQTGYALRQESVLRRLYDEVSLSSEDSTPTLRTFRPITDTHMKTQNIYLTNLPISLHTNSKDDVPHKKNEEYEGKIYLEKAINLQHGRRLTRKVSSDYPNTLHAFEKETENSIRTVEYAKNRPSITVGEYKIRNQKYKDDLKAAQEQEQAVQDAKTEED